MADDHRIAQPGSPLGPPHSVRLRLVRAANVALGSDPSLADLYQARFEGAPPKVRARGGLVTIEYGPRFRLGDWGMAGLRADLSATRLLGLEVEHAASDSELTIGRPAGPVLLRFAHGARGITIHRPVGAAARVKVTGGASGLTFRSCLPLFSENGSMC